MLFLEFLDVLSLWSESFLEESAAEIQSEVEQGGFFLARIRVRVTLLTGILMVNLVKCHQNTDLKLAS